MPIENLASPSITSLDATPPGILSAGIGAKASQFSVKDYVQVTAANLVVGSTYRLVRIPTNAIINTLFIATDKALDSNAGHTLSFDLNLAFSDSQYDGVRPDLAGTVPKTTNDGSVTTFAAYVNPNKLFGNIPAANLPNASAFFSTNLIFNGLTVNYTLPQITGNPLWNLFGFQDARGYPLNPGGMFDIVAYVSANALTGVTGNLWCYCEYNI